MAYEPKPGDLSLFPASDEDKDRAGKELVLTGKGLDLSGQECFISVYRATTREGQPVQTKDGKQVYNVRLKARTGGSAGEPSQQREREDFSSDTIDDDIPF